MIGMVCLLLGIGATGNAIAQTAPQSALLRGYVDARQAAGAYTLSVSANNNPVTATFFLTNILNNERSSVVADCVGDASSQALRGTCVKVIGTLPMSAGTYLISARVMYADGTGVFSNQISVNVPLPSVVVPIEEPIVTPVVKPRPVVKPTPKPTPVVKPVTVFGQALASIRSQNNTPQQQAALAAPVILEMNDISLGLRGGERDIADATGRLDILRNELWGEVDMTDPAVQAKTKYQNAKEYGTTVDGSIIRIMTISLATTTAEVIVSSTTTSAKGELVVRNERKKITKETVQLNGYALPNMYVTVYIYGQTEVFGTVRSGNDGNWVYEFEKTLPNGTYEAYAAINERMGKVIAKSSRFGFEKTGDMITMEQTGLVAVEATSTEATTSARTSGISLQMAIILVILGGGFLLGTVILVRFLIKRRQELP